MIITKLSSMNRGNHFNAITLRCNETPTLIKPFIGVDHAWMSAPTFPPHSHSGISAVSYQFLNTGTDIENKDSLGNHNFIRAGGLHWVAAGSGIVHQEDPAETGKTVHQLQIFVDLGDDKRNIQPFSLSLEPQDVPIVRMNGVTVRIPLGQFGGVSSPLNPPTEVNLFDISLDNGAELALSISANHNSFVMPILGSLLVNDQIFDYKGLSIPVFPAQSEEQIIRLSAINGSAQVVVFSGRPISSESIFER